MDGALAGSVLNQELGVANGAAVDFAAVDAITIVPVDELAADGSCQGIFAFVGVLKVLADFRLVAFNTLDV